MRDLQFRSQAWLHLFVSLGELVVGVLPVLILTGSAGLDPAIARASLLAVGIFAVTTGLMDCFVTPGLRRLDSAVRRGDLDLALVRPAPTFFYAVLRWIEPTELSRCLTGAAVVVAVGVDARPGALFAAAVWAFAGTVAYCAFWADLVLLTFWLSSIEPVNDLAATWRGAGQYPRGFFPRTLQIAFVSVTPAALMGAYPAEQLLDPAHVWWAPVVVVVSCAVTAVIWRLGLARYESASS